MSSLNDRAQISFEESALRQHADSACRVYTLTLNRKSLDTRAGQSSLKGSAYCRGEGKSDISSIVLKNSFKYVFMGHGMLLCAKVKDIGDDEKGG